MEGIREFHKIQRAMTPFAEPGGMPIGQEDLAPVRTAIFVLSRQSGEGRDRENAPGDFQLTQEEKTNLRFLREHYEELVVVINVGGMVDLSFIDELPVSALIYFTQGGEEGGNALADLLCGAKNFSGKLTTTWPMAFEDVPSKGYSHLSEDILEQDYAEGIYVGYRYFDTFSVPVRYAFGYGLSYTNFAVQYEGVKITPEVTVQALIMNTGEAAGQEVAQLYTSVPFGSGSEEKRLVAFQKTGLLSPGESETVQLSFGLRDLCVYDEGRSAWVLQGGEYVLRLGNASDHTAPVAVLTAAKDYILEKCQPVCQVTRPVVELAAPGRKEEELQALPRTSLDEVVPETITHRYEKPEEPVDDLVTGMTQEQLIQLVVGGTTHPTKLQVSALGASGTTTGELYESCGIPNTILSDGPAGLNLTSHVVQVPDGSVKAARVPQNLEAYKRYLFGFNKIALMSQMVKPEEGESHYQYATAWPCSMLLAQSFDPALLERVGDGVGKEMEAFGVTVWLVPGMNIHRNPLCGRTFEYYSEDPLVSGKMAAAIVCGVQRHPGKGMSVKHFVANNCELERNRSSSNVHERALREIYLRGFEIAVKEADPMTVMAAYNRVNGLHCVNNYDLLVKVLRNEWGYKGCVISDWDSMKADPQDATKPLTGDVQKAHAAQCDLVMPGRKDQLEALAAGLQDGHVDRKDLERSAMRVLGMIRKNTVLESK